MYSNEYSYQKLPPPLEEYLPEKTGDNPAELSGQSGECTNYEDKELLEMILIAVKFKRETQEFYKRLSCMARSEKDRNLLHQIWLDEQKHEKFFFKICNKIGGAEPEAELEPREILDDLNKNYGEAVFDKLHCIEFYRKIMFSFSDTEIRDMLYEIITDEQIHALKLFYLLIC